MQIRRLIAPLVLALCLSGCPATKVYKEGLEHQEFGNEYLGAIRYLDALDINENHRKARESLIGIAKAAYDEKLGTASAYESRQEFAQALTEYQELAAFMKRLKRAEAMSFEVINVTGKIDEMQNSAAEERYVAAEALLVARNFTEAIEAYRAAQVFKAAYKDTNEKIATSYYEIGEQEVAAKRYRKAADAFSQAVGAGGKGFRGAAHRAGEIYTSLGTHFLEKRACRKAVRDLRLARDFGEDVEAQLTQSEECAVTPVAVMPFENPTGINPAGLALGDTLADQVLARVKTGASEFVRIVDRSALDAILAEQGLTGASPKGLRGVRYLVTGRLTQVLVEEPNVKQSPMTTSEARESYACTKTNTKGESYQATCTREVTLGYLDFTAKSSVRLVASAKIIDVATGEQVGAPQLTALLEDAVHYASNFTRGGVPVNPLDRSSSVELYGRGIVELAGARNDVQPTSALVGGAIERLGGDLAGEIVRQVDVEDALQDPATLTLSVAPAPAP